MNNIIKLFYLILTKDYKLLYIYFTKSNYYPIIIIIDVFVFVNIIVIFIVIIVIVIDFDL